jgi:hypothetical protein
MKSRLNYDYVDITNKKRIKPTTGIPQGGIDSPYLFNILFHELDKFVTEDLQSYLNNSNSKVGLSPNGRRPVNKTRINIRDKILRLEKKVSELKTKNFELKKSEIFNIENDIKLRKREIIKMPYYDEKIKIYHLFYVRYADDWILLTNADLPTI